MNMYRALAKMMLNPNHELAIKHFNYSLSNIKVAKLLKKYKFNALATFHLQQAVELTLKGILILDRKESTYEWEHNPLVLMDKELKKDEKRKVKELTETYKEREKRARFLLKEGINPEQVFYEDFIYDNILGSSFKDFTFEHPLFRQVLTTLNPILIKEMEPHYKKHPEELGKIFNEHFKLRTFFLQYTDKIANFNQTEIKRLLTAAHNAFEEMINHILNNKRNTKQSVTNRIKKQVLGISDIVVLSILLSTHESTTRYFISNSSLNPDVYEKGNLWIVKEFNNLVRIAEEITTVWLKFSIISVKINKKR